jgi:hypothetical protein
VGIENRMLRRIHGNKKGRKWKDAGGNRIKKSFAVQI